jgi:hypothetical protein
MKQILGDNQFFGVNHHDIDKGDKSKELFTSDESIIHFIQSSIDFGLDGFMINSNNRGYNVVKNISNSVFCEFHYSIPYPHKFAAIVNENGMLELLRYVFKKSSYSALFLHLPLFFLTGNLKKIIPLIVDLEIPKNLPKGSYVYLQNIVTDLLLGIKRYDLIEAYCNSIIQKGYFPGLITLNPILLDEIIGALNLNFEKDLIVCFNINHVGFNVFPNKEDVEKFVFKNTGYKKMGMSIFSSGGSSSIESSLNFIKKLPLDYVVYGSSKLENIEKNYNILK